jgi:hypothetical protein
MENMRQAIRRVEREVLDRYHKQFDLLLRPDEVAIRFILMAYGDALRHYERVRGEGALFRGQRYWVQSFTHGLSHCLRWLAAEPSRQIVVPAASPEQVYQEAKKLLLWSANYEALAGDHSAWSRGYIQAEIDEAAKTVTFSNPGDANAALFARQTEALQMLMDNDEHPAPIDALREDFGQFISSAAFGIHGLHLPWQQRERRNIVQAVYQWLEQALWPELAPETDLDGLTLADVRHLLAFLYIFCCYRMWMTDLSEDMTMNRGEFRSDPLRATEETFVGWTAERSGVSIEATRAFVELLTLDVGNFHAKVGNQPFIRSRSGILFLLPRLLMHLNLSRMLAGAINKGRREQVYSRLIEHFEQTNLDVIEAVLRRETQFEVAREKPLCRAGQDPLTPDFLVYEPSAKRLLIVDYKHVQVPYSMADVDNKMDDFEEWREKMRKYCELVRMNPVVVAPHLAAFSHSDSLRVGGMILSRWPLPLPVTLEDDQCIADWTSLNRHLQRSQIGHVDVLVEWAQTRPDVEAPTSFRYRPQDFKVGEWTYRRMILVTDAPEQEGPGVAEGSCIDNR